MSERERTSEEDDELTYEKWKAALREGELLGQQCEDCGRGTVTAAAACPNCGSRALTVVSLPREGEVHSETRINVAPAGFEGPYTVAVVELTEGVRITAHVRGTVSIGDTVAFEGVLEEDTEPAPIFE